MVKNSIKISQGKGVTGHLMAPASKSYAQRAIVLSILAKGVSTLTNFDICADSSAALNIAQSLGCKVNHCAESKTVEIDSTNMSLSAERIDVGESGFLFRVFSTLATLFSGQVIVDGCGSLKSRQFTADLYNLERLGVKADLYDDANPPITILSKIKNYDVTLDCSAGSQLLSGLLITASVINDDFTIHVERLASRNYVDMTISILEHFGVKIERDGYKCFKIAANQSIKPAQYSIEGDWSSASCMLVAGAICGSNLKIDNLNVRSRQSDRAMIDVLDLVSASFSVDFDGIEIGKSALKPFSYNATDTPDLIPALVALAASINGESRIAGTYRLQNKESNRLFALKSEFTKLGVEIDISHENLMIIKGGEIKGGVSVETFGDHRIAMALSIAALSSKEPITINGTDCVGKSYPNFWSDLKSILQ